MFVNGGKLWALEAQYPSLEICKWHLFTNVITIDEDTELDDLTEAGWVGYNYVVVGSLNPAVMVGQRATTTPVTGPTWTNGEGVPVQFEGWFLTDESLATLIAAGNLGTTTIAAGLTVAYTPTVTDREE